jgi:hypothetical protein
LIIAGPVPVSDPSLAVRRPLKWSVWRSSLPWLPGLPRLPWLPWLPWLSGLPRLPWLSGLPWLVVRRARFARLAQLELLRLLDKERLGPLAPWPAIGSARAARTAGTIRTGRVSRLIWGTRRGMRAEVGGQCRSSGVSTTLKRRSVPFHHQCTSGYYT